VAVSPRFVHNRDGTENEKLTGLNRLRDGDCLTFFAGDVTRQNPRPWQAALAAANQLAAGYCGLTDGSAAGDWRLPNLRELQSLIDYSQVNPALPPGHPFLNTTTGYLYWSSTPLAPEPHLVWSVIFFYGQETLSNKSLSNFVRAVRGGL